MWFIIGLIIGCFWATIAKLFSENLYYSYDYSLVSCAFIYIIYYLTGSLVTLFILQYLLK